VCTYVQTAGGVESVSLLLGQGTCGPIAALHWAMLRSELLREPEHSSSVPE